MIYPHTEDGKVVEAWVVCLKCNGSRHRVIPGEETPYWWCQDEKHRVEAEQEVEYLDEEN